MLSYVSMVVKVLNAPARGDRRNVSTHTLLDYVWEASLMPNAIGQPAYRRIADDLRMQIDRGELPIGSAIPSTTRLCSTYGVSATVARAAVTELRNDGLVQGQPGKAVYVVATPDSISQKAVELESLSKDVDHLRRDLTTATARLEQASSQEQLEELRATVEDLRRQVGDVHALLLELYTRTGHDVPRSAKSVAQDIRRAAQ